MTSGRQHDHWEAVYAAKADAEVSWYQEHSEQSLQLVRQVSPDRRSSIIDVGGGASRLVDDLLAEGYADITVLDIAETALARSRTRLADKANKVRWIAADITCWTPLRTWEIWHDRAVFHFLTEDKDQDAYIAALGAATLPGATAIIATFGLDGPDRCSGLPVQRYSATSLAARIGPHFSLASEASETHVTPWKARQHFVYAVLKRA
jgi:hypothetical protein